MLILNVEYEAFDKICSHFLVIIKKFFKLYRGVYLLRKYILRETILSFIIIKIKIFKYTLYL